MNLQALKKIKLPKLPSKNKIKKAMPTIMATVSVIGNCISTYLAIDHTVKATRIMDEMSNKGATKKEIAKAILPGYALPMLIFVGAQACTIESNILSKRQQLGLTTALVGADYKYRLAKKKAEQPDIYVPEVKGDLPRIDEGLVLFYDEYLETPDQDGYFTMRETDWYKGYAEFQEQLSDPNYYCGIANFWSFYEHMFMDDVESGKLLYSELADKIAGLGEWATYAAWNLDDWGTAKIVKLDEAFLADGTRYYIVHWLCMPSIEMGYFEEGEWL